EVERRLADAEARGIPLVAVEAALILEADWRSAFHRLVVVTCSPELQLRRLMDRDGLDRASAEARLRAQLPVADKVAAGDHVVCNDGDPEALASQVADLLSSLRKDRDDHQQGNP
ncbi:MAG: dephospho-CoA kinase, partial [Deltaproteobacteria bacterium]|nr:dephospho-CoA kinase [Deltaproteobacteria bacterium]